jgi:uncharacterized protein YodC (DUF2158 family)
MSDEFKPGEVVQLNSGGPRMTVDKLAPFNGVMHANCDWFEGTAQKSGSFPVASLKKVEEARRRAQVGEPGAWS